MLENSYWVDFGSYWIEFSLSSLLNRYMKHWTGPFSGYSLSTEWKWL